VPISSHQIEAETFTNRASICTHIPIVDAPPGIASEEAMIDDVKAVIPNSTQQDFVSSSTEGTHELVVTDGAGLQGLERVKTVDEIAATETVFRPLRRSTRILLGRDDMMMHLSGIL
jgi:hypothetical protein